MAKEENTYIGSPDNPKTVAVVSYITFIGWLIAYFGLYPTRKTELSAYHLRQSLLIHIISFLIKVVFSFNLYGRNLADVLVIIFSAALFVIWLIGFIDALNGRVKPAPVIGRWAQNLFRNL